MADVPAVVHPNFEVIEHTSDGGLLLATSSLSGRLVVELMLLKVKVLVYSDSN